MSDGLQRRIRVPRPLLPRRLATGRGATEQPNAPSDGEARLDLNFWVVLILTGIATGLFGDAMMFVLRVVQHLAYGYGVGSFSYTVSITFQEAVERASGLRRIEALAVAGVFGGLAWYLLRKHTPGEKTDVEDEVWNGTGDLSFRRSLATSVISEVVVGLGASLGREAAPRLMGAASGSILGRWRGMSPAQRRLLVACGAGAGLAAVYNVPLGGTLFIAEVLCGALTLPVVLPALTCSTIATVTAWIYLPNHATYTGIPVYGFGPSETVWAILAGPAIGLVAVGYVRIIGWASAHRPTGRASAVAPLVAFLILGVVALRYPQLLGNGKGIAHQAFLGDAGIALLLALFVLKPLVTALCLGSGASGGLFTPTMSAGAALGGMLGSAWSLAWPGGAPGAYAMIGASAMLGAAMQAPLTGIVMVLELTHSGLDLTLPLIAATLVATGVARYLDGYSIYSARLPAK